MEFPKASEDLLPDLYERLDEANETAESVLRKQFWIENKGNARVVVFGEATKDDFLEAMHEAPEIMVPFFMKISGLPSREFERVYGVKSVDAIKTWTQKDLRESQKGEVFAEALTQVLPDRLYLETCLYTFYLLWENDQRRHQRAKYEQVVRERLEDAGFPNRKGEDLAGKPDIVLPPDKPFKALGEVRDMHRKDFRKRNKNFDSEARRAKENFPDAKFVVVAKFPKHQIDNNRRELRDMVLDLNPDDIDAVIFPDEFDRLYELLEEWGISRSTPTKQTEL
ncbi:hypothetical protein [Halorussus caseinilyticus]|uniref:Uncharacterized protein n=1 Tax=Halorussus caseinilyticus TaxID=3034025 RepID=A0ABD5WR55_9EURY|nr:hypothetical protein [Halorussus sp. DT72]